MDNLLVKSKPLSKLCEYNGGDLPEGYKSDCYGNVDETVWACKEKKRILVSLFWLSLNIGLHNYSTNILMQQLPYYLLSII
jgi:hypothetical protein